MNAFDPVASRQSAWQKVAQAGFQTNPSLPLLEAPIKLRSAEDVARRIFCLHIVAAYAHGFPAPAAQLWLQRENLTVALSRREKEFLGQSKQYSQWGQVQVNPLYVLSWCTSLVEDLDLGGWMPDDLVERLPDIRKPESSDAVRDRMALRAGSEILVQLDLAYCLHWAWRDATLKRSHKLPPDGLMVIAERRKALEWITHSEDWDDVPLDT